MWPDGSGVAVKVCGITRAADAAACVRLGVWGIGFVFADASPRRVGEREAAALAGAVPATTARVGVFVGASPREMAAVARRVGLTHLQVHGDADPDAARAASGLPVVQGIRVDGPAALDRARASTADLVLLDAAVAGLHGGTGTTFDWSLLGSAGLGRPYALAGGLRPGNVADAVVRLRPSLVDVSSGVESAPGEKDADLVAAFVAAVGGARRKALA
ncbi:phosphoribosylanthranilate isomerase [Miltoncostaea oceani]|jgi:phosphoribosylanthranilate isomerase|uniref:phosphoribosylanthranilate isomerase n=1 Tax=Miltoncostaea oceani TaxID=2843216 RepID=UPI001C3DA211|nr:phosphoribosylanthranilate isomerase [Miltoncostaea oceani]